MEKVHLETRQLASRTVPLVVGIQIGSLVQFSSCQPSLPTGTEAYVAEYKSLDSRYPGAFGKVSLVLKAHPHPEGCRLCCRHLPMTHHHHPRRRRCWPSSSEESQPSRRPPWPEAAIQQRPFYDKQRDRRGRNNKQCFIG